MARFKKFDGGKKLSDYEPLGFELNEQEFECYPAIQGAVFLEFAKEAEREGAAAADALYSFLEKSMSETEYLRLQEVLHNPDVIIDIDVIGEIVKYLVEEYSSRPTSEPTS